ncbi:MAG: MotA/TolQ/ExbB proton channel family protein [Verrucomicrobiota bacterium]
MNKKVSIYRFIGFLVIACVPSATSAQNEMNKAVEQSKKDLEVSLLKLSELREAITKEKLPMSRELNKLEDELIELHEQYKKESRTLDSRNLDLSNLKREIKAREAENSFISNLFDEYVRNFKSRVHISELKRYAHVQREAELAPENPNLIPAQKFEAQIELVNESLNRLIELGGGATFDGYAISNSGDEIKGRFGILGPVVLFASEDGQSAGLVDQKLGSNEPAVRPVQAVDPAEEVQMNQAIKPMLDTGKGMIVFDPSEGDAAKYVEAEDTLIDELRKGGITMWPIIILAIAAILVTLAKFIHLSLVPQVSRKKTRQLLTYINGGNFDQAKSYVAGFKGPMGEMLRAAVDHIREPKDLIEEVMFEVVMETKLKLQSFIAFVALSAAAAPLLGLLGTVTGMINTFKMITIYGTGDAKMLSGGISEALLTTKWGLIVAIPSVIAASYLNRKAKGIVDNMEKAAISFVNTISRRANGSVSVEAHEASDGRDASPTITIQTSPASSPNQILVPPISPMVPAGMVESEQSTKTKAVARSVPIPKTPKVAAGAGTSDEY